MSVCGVRSLLIPNSDGKNVNTTTALVAGSLSLSVLWGAANLRGRGMREGGTREKHLWSLARDREIFLCLSTRWLRRRLESWERITAPTPCNDILTAKATLKLVLRHALFPGELVWREQCFTRSTHFASNVHADRHTKAHTVQIITVFKAETQFALWSYVERYVQIICMHYWVKRFKFFKRHGRFFHKLNANTEMY
jgi:hypothetical protein